MTKTILLFVTICGAAFAGKAQLPGYAFGASAGTYTPLSGGTPVVLTYNGAVNADDGIATPANAVPIGFPFVYNGISYTTVRPCANGFLSFSSTALANNTDTWTNNLAGGVSTQRPIVAALWDDLDMTTGSVTWTLSGTTPSRVLTVEWAAAKWDYGAGGAVISFQIKLYETTNVIEFIYQQENTAVANVSNALGASIGLTSTATGNNTFLSLTDAGTSSDARNTETSTITTKPATGQIYRWTPYCTAGANNTTAGGEKISNVSFGTINNNSTSNAGYENFSALSSFTIQGSTVPISISVSNPKATDQAMVWIDFNHNGSFADAGELVYISPVAAGPYTANISIPALSATVLPGLTRMRVRVQDTNVSPANNTSCGTSEWGQVEDYTLDINVCAAAAFTTQPANTTACNGGNATITVAATGTFLTYQWQVSTNGGSTYTNLSNNNTYSGVTTATLTIMGAITTMSGYLYRVAVNGTCTPANTTSNAATLTVNTPAVITQQPEAGKAVCIGSSTSFTVAVSGNSPTYQWQVSTDGGITYTNITGATSATLQLVNTTLAMNGNRYRAMATVAACGSVTTSAGLLTVNPLPIVTLQAAPLNAIQPGVTTFVTAGSTPRAVSYAWTLNGNAVPNATGATLNTDYRGIGAYRVTVTDVNGCQSTSDTITVSGNPNGQMFLFPNPNKGRFNLRFYGPGFPRSYIIFNAAGVEVFKKIVLPVNLYSREEVNLPWLPKGYYVLRMQFYYTENEISGPFVVQ